MVLFNYSTKELTSKIVYYGPGLCGKTTNLQFVYDSLPGTINKGKMLSLATKTDRTLFFDFLPIDLGMIRGMRTRLQLYTVPGQVFYNTTRKLVLKGADGVVFVADSQERLLEQNLESFRNLEENLLEHGMNLADMPLVIQFNKRDLPEAMNLDALNTQLNRFNAPIYEAVATTGIGVHETLKAITRLVLNSLKTKYADKRESRPEPATEAAARAAVAAREVVSATLGATMSGASPHSRSIPPPAPHASEPLTPVPAAASMPEPAPIQKGVRAEASTAAPVALSEGFEDSPDLALPEALDLDIGLAAPDSLPTLEELDLAPSPTEMATEPDAAQDDLLLEVATDEDQRLIADSGADEVLELAEIIDEATLEPGARDPILADLTLDASDEDPLDLPDLRSSDPLGLERDPIDPPASDDHLVDGPSLYSDSEPEHETPPAAVTPEPFLNASLDAGIEVPSRPPLTSIPVDAARYSRFEEDRAALVLDDFDPRPLPLSHETGSLASDDDHAGEASFAGDPEGPSHIAPVASVVAAARPQARRSGEINVPVCLSIGDQKIQLELKITLDMVSGIPRLAGVEAIEERA